MELVTESESAPCIGRISVLPLLVPCIPVRIPIAVPATGRAVALPSPCGTLEPVVRVAPVPCAPLRGGPSVPTTVSPSTPSASRRGSLRTILWEPLIPGGPLLLVQNTVQHLRVLAQ